MSERVVNYQCPACTAPLIFSSQSGKLECEHCGNVYDIETFDQLYGDRLEEGGEEARPHWSEEEAGSPWSDLEAADLKVYNCPSCGAEIITDITTAATRCLYCGNPSIVPGQLEGNLRPDVAIPFKLSREEALTALKNHYLKKPLLPKAFQKENHIQEVRGLYVPFWLFDCQTDATIHYKGTQVRSWSEGDVDVTETSHYRIVRQGELAFEKVPVDGSSKMPDELMDAIEPYDYSQLAPFSFSYLPGFFADKYDVGVQESIQRVNDRISKSTQDSFARTLDGYSSWQVERQDIHMEHGEITYALLPVWMLSTKWKGKDYLFAMNGQTGKLVGDLPISKGRALGWFFGLWGGLAAALGGIFFALGLL